MIAPALTSCPANTFTPSRFAFESRPFLEEPSPFLCAIRGRLLGRLLSGLLSGPRLLGRSDALDLDPRKLASVPLRLLVPHLGPELEHLDLRAAHVFDDRGRDGARELGAVGLHRLAAGHEHLGREGAAGIQRLAVDEQRLTLLDAVLLAANFDHCIHVSAPAQTNARVMRAVREDSKRPVIPPAAARSSPSCREWCPSRPAPPRAPARRRAPARPPERARRRAPRSRLRQPPPREACGPGACGPDASAPRRRKPPPEVHPGLPPRRHRPRRPPRRRPLPPSRSSCGPGRRGCRGGASAWPARPRRWFPPRRWRRPKQARPPPRPSSRPARRRALPSPACAARACASASPRRPRTRRSPPRASRRWRPPPRAWARPSWQGT